MKVSEAVGECVGGAGALWTWTEVTKSQLQFQMWDPSLWRGLRKAPLPFPARIAEGLL